MRKVLRVTLWSCLGLIALVVLALCAVTCYLTPSRLSEIISREMTEYLNADVKVKDARFTFWSSFPRFMLETDSVIVISHSLDAVPAKSLAKVPGNPKLLATAASLEGGINIPQMIKGNFVMHDLSVSRLYVNLVTINDSVNNFDILPRREDEMEKIHFFTTNSLTLTRPEGIDIYFAKTDTKGRVELDSVVMKRLETETNYNLTLDGKISASTASLNLLSHFPFSLDGDVDMGFHPFKLKFENFNINLKSLHSKLDMTLDLEGNMKISDLNYQVSMINVLELLKAFPWMPLAELNNLNTDLEVKLTARLDRPYTLSSGELPWFTLTADVAGNTINYLASDKRSIPLRYSDITAALEFNGLNPQNSAFIIQPFTLSSEATEMTLSGRASQLLGSPRVSIDFTGKSNLANVAKRFPELKNWDLEGALELKGTANGVMESITPEGLQNGLKNIEMEATGNIEGLKCVLGDMRIEARDLAMEASSRMPGNVLADMASQKNARQNEPNHVEALITASDLTFTGEKSDFSARKLTLKTAGPNHPELLSSFSAQDLEKIFDLGFSSQLEIDGVAGDISGYRLKVDAIQVAAAKKDYTGSDTSHRPLDITLSGKNAKLSAPDGSMTYATDLINVSAMLEKGAVPKSVNLDGIDLKANNFGMGFGKGSMITLHDASASYGRVAPRRYLPGAAKAPAAEYFAVKASSGLLKVAGNKVANPISNIDVYYTPDSLNIHSVDIRCLSSQARISGTVVNLMEFVNSGMTAPLKVRMDIDCDTVNINQLARTYYRGEFATNSADSLRYQRQDTVCISIPKNIDALLTVSAKESVYTNLLLYDLAGNVRVADGIATVDNVNISTDFGHANIGAVYNTADRQDMSLSLDANLSDIDVEKALTKFHSLQELMPEISNLHGMVSISLEGQTLIFPDMYLNMPSLFADIGVKGWDLKIHQNDFIHRLARKLFIRTDSDLHINDMSIRALVRDNLVELYPFDFQLENYKLQALGTNNFGGDLYYHIAVKKSPVPFPFGVNLEGTFKDPRIRLGSAHYDSRKGEEITLNNEASTQVNLISEARHLADLFLRKASQSTD